MSFTPDKSKWAPGTVYIALDTVLYGKNLYVCTTFHTANFTFATDLESGYWKLVNEPAINKNYLVNGGFEGGVNDNFFRFTTTLTNKIPTGSISIGNNSFNNDIGSGLAGTYSLRSTINSGIINAGDGICSPSVTINPEDKAKILKISFSYSVNTGSSLMNFSGTSSNTWAVYIYDEANSAWIQPAGVYNIVQGSGVGKCEATFQTPINATTIKLAIICINSTTIGSIQMLWDSFYLGTQSVSYGPAMSDWTSYTPTGAWTTNTTYAGYWRRVGDSLQVNASVVVSGAPTATTFSLNLPSGLVIDTAKIVGTSNEAGVFGTAKILDNGVQFYRPGTVVYSNTTSVKVDAASTSTAPTNDTLVSNTAPFTWAANDTMWLQFQVPIVGWSSNSVMSADTDTRVVALSRASGTQISVPNTTYTYVDFSSANVDTHAAWRSGVSYNSGTGAWTTSPAYVVPVAGIYHINCSFLFGPSTGSKQVLITKNGTSFGNSANDATTTSSTTITTSATGSFVAGDLIQVSLWQNSGAGVTEPGSISAAWSHLEIQRLSGPAVIAASETVAAYYNTGAGQTIPNGSAFTVVNFNNKVYDSHNAVTTGAGVWKFTAPISGTYLINAGLVYSGFVPGAVGNVCRLAIMNSSGVEIHRIASFICQQNTAAMPVGINGTGGQIKLRAGEYIQIYTNHGESTAKTLALADFQNTFSVVRVGNYV